MPEAHRTKLDVTGSGYFIKSAEIAPIPPEQITLMQRMRGAFRKVFPKKDQPTNL